MPYRHPMNTSYVSAELGDLQGWMFHPLRPGESLTGLECTVSMQMDKVVQEMYTPPLIVDIGVWRVPLTLVQSAFGDEYVKAFSGEYPPAAALDSLRGSGGNPLSVAVWQQLKYDLVAEIARTFFSRQNVEFTNKTPFDDYVQVGNEFLPAAAGEATVVSNESTSTVQGVSELTEGLKQQRLEEATYLEALNRFGISGREARHIPEVVMWERRMLTPRQDLLVGGANEAGAGGSNGGTARTQISSKQFGVGNHFGFISSSTPAASLGVSINERRDKNFYSSDPSFLVGASLVRWATYRNASGFWGGLPVASAPGSYTAGQLISHIDLMTYADDWCPPGTGFNDALRLVPPDTDGGFVNANNRTFMAFDPMMFLSYGEQYFHMRGGIGAGRPEGIEAYDAVGNAITTQGNNGPFWMAITKAFCRLDIRTDLGEE